MPFVAGIVGALGAWVFVGARPSTVRHEYAHPMFKAFVAVCVLVALVVDPRVGVVVATAGLVLLATAQWAYTHEGYADTSVPKITSAYWGVLGTPALQLNVLPSMRRVHQGMKDASSSNAAVVPNASSYLFVRTVSPNVKTLVFRYRRTFAVDGATGGDEGPARIYTQLRFVEGSEIPPSVWKEVALDAAATVTYGADEKARDSRTHLDLSRPFRAYVQRPPGQTISVGQKLFDDVFEAWFNGQTPTLVINGDTERVISAGTSLEGLNDYAEVVTPNPSVVAETTLAGPGARHPQIPHDKVTTPCVDACIDRLKTVLIEPMVQAMKAQPSFVRWWQTATARAKEFEAGTKACDKRCTLFLRDAVVGVLRQLAKEYTGEASPDVLDRRMVCRPGHPLASAVARKRRPTSVHRESLSTAPNGTRRLFTTGPRQNEQVVAHLSPLYVYVLIHSSSAVHGAPAPAASTDTHPDACTDPALRVRRREGFGRNIRATPVACVRGGGADRRPPRVRDRVGRRCHRVQGVRRPARGSVHGESDVAVL